MPRKLQLVTVASIVLAAAAATGAGYASQSDGATTSLNASSVCPAGVTKAGVVRCAKLFAGARGVHLPKDPSDSTRYGAIRRGGERFYTRTGLLKLSSQARRQLAKLSGSGSSTTFAGNFPYASRIYEATVSGDKVTQVKTVVQIGETALMNHFFGGRVLEGTISAYRGKQEWASAPHLPVRIELARAKGGAVGGHIVNATKAVRSSTGRCLTALSAHPRTNPLRKPFTAHVRLARYPSMHAPFDDEMLLEWNADVSNMGTQYYASAASAMGGDPLGKRWLNNVHGTPGTGPSVSVRFVKGGGGAC